MPIARLAKPIESTNQTYSAHITILFRWVNFHFAQYERQVAGRLNIGECVGRTS